jgi:predicted TIM-barrel fold metal-dependent hydrolase
MVYRRDILKAGLLFLAAPLFNRAAFAQPQRRFIDVHCHFFNAADIPVRGFLQRVVLSDYATNKALSNRAESAISLSIWKGMVAKLADVVLKYSAPTPNDEMACLKGGQSCSGFSTKKSFPGEALQAPKGQRRLADVLQQHYQAAQSKSMASPQKGEDVDAFVEFVLKEMKRSGAKPPVSSSKNLKSLGSSLHSATDAIAQFVSDGRSFFSRYFSWAEVLTDYRGKIAEAYYTLYDPDHARLILSTPALVDYNYWLEDQSPSSLQDQVELMGLLSLRQSRPMHGYVAFDPLRSVRRKAGEPDPLDIAKEAVAKHGFLGVKLYSPMGFRPSGNADHTLSFPTYASLSEPEFGAKLDGALDSLYAWCDAEEIPILAHTTESQSAGPDFAARAEPRFWNRVLSQYPNLKLNLAHFGNFSQAFAAAGGSPVAAFGKTWEAEIGALIKTGRYPNLYADISYFYWALEGRNETQNVKAAKTLFAKYFEADPNVERLMFGTDWNMTGKAQGAANYVDSVEAFFRDIGLRDRQLDNLFFRNALRFLGLNGQTKATARLQRFYAAAGKPFPAFA